MKTSQEIMDEISYSDIQKMIDSMLNNNSFSFSTYVERIVSGKIPFSVNDMIQVVVNSIQNNIAQERRIYMSLILMGILGAILSNFSTFLQGKKVAQTAFYMVYLLFFSVLLGMFTKIMIIAQETLSNLLDFMKVLSPTFFMSMTFSEGAMASGAYYEWTLVLIAIVDFVLVKLILPGINIFFLLSIANQFFEKNMFSKMAELVRDLIKFTMKTMFGLMMGFNVVQGLILPVTSKLETSSFVKITGALPGVGNAVSNVATTVLMAGNLVKNAVGITGVIAVIIYCGIPVIRIVIHKFLFQLTQAIMQPVSDKRIVSCMGAMVEALNLLAYAVFVGSMMFVVSIALISAMTSM